MSWTCPHATILKGQKYFSCKMAMKEGVDYNLLENKMTVFCACQRWCNECGHVINTDGAKQCFEYHSKP